MKVFLLVFVFPYFLRKYLYLYLYLNSKKSKYTSLPPIKFESRTRHFPLSSQRSSPAALVPPDRRGPASDRLVRREACLRLHELSPAQARALPPGEVLCRARAQPDERIHLPNARENQGPEAQE